MLFFWGICSSKVCMYNVHIPFILICSLEVMTHCLSFRVVSSLSFEAIDSNTRNTEISLTFEFSNFSINRTSDICLPATSLYVWSTSFNSRAIEKLIQSLMMVIPQALKEEEDRIDRINMTPRIHYYRDHPDEEEGVEYENDQHGSLHLPSVDRFFLQKEMMVVVARIIIIILF